MLARHGHSHLRWWSATRLLGTRTPMSERSIFRIYLMRDQADHGGGRDDAVRAGKVPARRFRSQCARVSAIVVRNADAGPRASAEPWTICTCCCTPRGSTTLGNDIGAVQLPVHRAPAVRAQHRSCSLDGRSRHAVQYSESTTVLGRLVDRSGTAVRRVPRLADDPGRSAWWTPRFHVTPAQRPRLVMEASPNFAGELREVEIESLPFTERPALLEEAVASSTGPDFRQMLLHRGELDGVRLLKTETVTRRTRSVTRCSRREATASWAGAWVT